MITNTTYNLTTVHSQLLCQVCGVLRFGHDCCFSDRGGIIERQNIKTSQVRRSKYETMPQVMHTGTGHVRLEDVSVCVSLNDNGYNFEHAGWKGGPNSFCFKDVYIEYICVRFNFFFSFGVDNTCFDESHQTM